jgi:hypothetical protein
MARKPSLDRELGELYRLPLAEFTAARNALAKRLEAAGDGEGAKSVQARGKPSPSAWAVTQLLARHPDRMTELLSAGKEARAAQRQAMAGRGAEAFRAALEQARGLVDELRGEAESILAESGRPPSASVVERLAADFQALAFLPGAAETVRRGYLESDLEAPGFEVLAGLQLAATPRPVARRPARSAPAPGAGVANGGKAAGAARAETPAKPGRRGAAGVPKAVADGRKRWEEAVRARREREVAQAKDRVESAESEVARTVAEAAFRRATAKQAERAAAEAAKLAKAAREAADAASDRAERARAELAKAREALAAAARRDHPTRRSS